MGSVAADEARKYLQNKEVPKLFEGLMTGIIYNKPEDPVEFMQNALNKIRSDPKMKLHWDMFVDNPPQGDGMVSEIQSTTQSRKSSTQASERRSSASSRPASVMAQAARASIPQVPIVLFMGGPGGGKSRLPARVCESLQEHGLVHICMPDLIKRGISKYKDRYRDWKEAHRRYDEGELIPNHLALALIKAEMGKHPDAKSFLLEGYPRELQQVNDFEIEVKPINLAMILDYDESTLRAQMKEKGLRDRVIDQRIIEFKSKTLPAAKYFDDKMMLHLVAGEQDESIIFQQVRDLIEGAIGVSMPDAPEDSPVSGSENRSGSETAASGAAALAAHETESGGTSGAASGAPSEHEQQEEQEEEEEEEMKTEAVVAATAAVAAATGAAAVDLDVPIGLPNDAPVIIVIGAPGSNKGEYCKRIARKYEGFVHTSMGELLRKKIKDNPDDEEWKEYLNSMLNGEMIPTAVCRPLVYNAIHASENSWGYVLDGFPRSVDQAKDFEATVDRIDLALLIDCTEAYCLNTLKTRSEEADEENQRPDDTPAAVKLRLAMFKQNTLPMLKYFDEKSKLKVIEGDKGIDEIFQDVSNVIDSSLFIPQDNGSGKSLESSKNSNENQN